VEQIERLRLIDCFYTKEPVIDRWTFVFDERDSWTGYYTMLGTDDHGRMFSQFTSGFYEPGEANLHLGRLTKPQSGYDRAWRIVGKRRLSARRYPMTGRRRVC
jgi:hypothetical protein